MVIWNSQLFALVFAFCLNMLVSYIFNLKGQMNFYNTYNIKIMPNYMLLFFRYLQIYRQTFKDKNVSFLRVKYL